MSLSHHEPRARQPIKARTQQAATENRLSEQPVPFAGTATDAIRRAGNHPRGLSPSGVLSLQRTVGNRAVQRLLIQPRLTVGPARDQYEQEADRVADQVMRMPATPVEPSPRRRAEAATGAIQRETEEEETVQASPLAARISRLGQRAEEQDVAQGNGQEGFTASADVEAGIRSSQGGGTPLPDDTRSLMESRFGADFSAVRIHTGPVSVQMNRELGARAFTHGNDIYFGAGQYNPGSDEGRRLLAHELTHTIQQSGAAQLKRMGRQGQATAGQGIADARPSAAPTIQRAVGFEFQTNWGVRFRPPGRFSRPQKFSKGEILHPYPGFNMTVDEAGTRLGAEIEWVVDPPIPENAGLGTLLPIMQQLEAVAGAMVAHQNKEKFRLNEATGIDFHKHIEVFPNIKGAVNGADMKANPQVTGGVRLDQMVTLMKELGRPNANDASGNGQFSDVRRDLVGMGGQAILENSANAASAINGSDKLKGLAAQIIAYLKAGALQVWEQPTPQKAYDYAKLIGKLMARTDFGSQFKMLDQQERQPFEANPQTFVDLILQAAGNLDENTHVFQRGVKRDARQPQKGVFNFPVTRRDWLMGIVRGVDQLSSKHMPQWKSELEGLGALGGKTDVVGNNEQGVILEFRTVRQQMPYTQWKDFALQAFAYLIHLNNRLSPQQQQAADEQALQEWMQGFNL